MKIIRRKHKRGAPKIEYTQREEQFYKLNKEKIMAGLNYVPKNMIKRIFFSSVNEEKEVNKLSDVQAMNKTLRSRTFSTEEENFEYYKKEIIDKTFKGHKRDIKSYLGIPQNVPLNTDLLKKDSNGWAYEYEDKTVYLVRQGDTKDDGYKIVYA